MEECQSTVFIKLEHILLIYVRPVRDQYCEHSTFNLIHVYKLLSPGPTWPPNCRIWRQPRWCAEGSAVMEFSFLPLTVPNNNKREIETRRLTMKISGQALFWRRQREAPLFLLLSSHHTATMFSHGPPPRQRQEKTRH